MMLHAMRRCGEGNNASASDAGGDAGGGGGDAC